MSDAYIVSAVRTPVGKFLGSLKDIPATALGAMVVKAAVERAGADPARVEDVIMGCVLPAGLGQNPARQAAIRGGIPPAAGALTINKVCGSGLKAVALAAQAIRCGDHDLVVAGGMESMSRSPYLLPSAREGSRLGHAQMLDSMVHDGLWDIYNDFHMGITGEMVAEKHGITRAQQDAYAVESHRKAAAAMARGDFAAEILAVELVQKKGAALSFVTDESVRSDTTLEALAKLRPAFKKDGTVTAGNAPGCNDGAAALLVASEKAVRELGLKPLARILGATTGGLAPEWVMLAPVVATQKLNRKLGVSMDFWDLVELNEAFSVQALGVMKELEADAARINVNGGAVAIGHPIGASGARVLVTLLHAMRQRNAKRGLASLCLGGGNAVSLGVELC
ncbi:MAG: acetyl-CoA C-acetyltransferase [Planctomycetes bacterium]|nr:acetyl-CoA C-acetyltransferase [Planctomycetota bacterium]